MFRREREGEDRDRDGERVRRHRERERSDRDGETERQRMRERQKEEKKHTEREMDRDRQTENKSQFCFPQVEHFLGQNPEQSKKQGHLILQVGMRKVALLSSGSLATPTFLNLSLLGLPALSNGGSSPGDASDEIYEKAASAFHK